MPTVALLHDIEVQVRHLFSQYQHPYLYYHTLAHTSAVVKHTEEIAAQYLLNDYTRFIVTAAAWFHDTGHLLADMPVHEQKSIELMTTFLLSKNEPLHVIADISQCIMATRMPVHPASLPEQIICDADTYHLGTDDFFVQNELIRLELEARLKQPVVNWPASSLAFLEAHQYYTDYCRQLLAEGKRNNIRKLMAQIVK
jgi:predicted metal-dependent HD superfamily phosphohydrolase